MNSLHAPVGASTSFLKVTIYSADNVPKMDLLSETDPFLTLRVGGREFRTKTLENAGSSPQWREDFIFSLEPEQNEIIITMYDQDDQNKELIGSLKINFVEELQNIGINAVDKVYVLQEGLMGRDKVTKPSIRVVLEIGQTFKNQNSVTTVGILTVVLNSGADIVDPSQKALFSNIIDPYVVTSIENHTFRSKTCSRTKDPIFDQKMRFLIDSTVSDGVLRFSVYDHDLLSSDDFICFHEQKVGDLIGQVKEAKRALHTSTEQSEVTFSVDLYTNAESGHKKNGTLSFKASFEEYTDQVQAFYKYWFELLDNDKSGTLDIAEFREFIRSVSNKNLTEQELDDLFKDIDVDGNNKLDPNEVARYFSTKVGAEFLDGQIFMSWMAQRDSKFDPNLSKV